MSFWQSLFGGSKEARHKKRDMARYEKEKLIALSKDPADRRKLALDTDTHPEILYYLAQNDTDPSVRRAVAENIATPVQASSVLLIDKDQDVRLALAERLVRLLPDLSHDKQGQLYAFTIQTLGALALDEVLKIRMALSSALKEHAHAPPKVVSQLARDIEREVSEPVLRYCMALPDADLLDILKNHPASWAVLAVAERPQVSGPVALAVIETDDVPASVSLLGNKNAVITADTLGAIVTRSKGAPQLQKAVAVRKNLTPALARELAGFVDKSVMMLLQERTDFDKDTLEEISKTVRRRVEFADEGEQGSASAEERVRRMIAEKSLSEDTITDAVGMRDRDFVMVALAAKLHTSKADIEKIMALQTPKPVVAISWKAGLSMRTAFLLQKEIALIPPKELIYPRGGTDYPLDNKELEWQLEFLGFKK